MSQSNHSQPLCFRETEIKQLLQWVKAGESASIVGTSGVGKSNLFNHLLDPAVQANYLGADANQYAFIRTNFHAPPDFSDRSIFSLILEQFKDAQRLGIQADSIDKIQAYHEALLDAQNDTLKVQHYFKLALETIFSNPKRRLVFVFDQFDAVYREVEGRLLANLRGLRETYKYRLMYLVFTRDTLPVLAATDSGREEFYELMAANVLGLGPYNKEDAAILLRRVSDRNQRPLDDDMINRLYHLTGGHAGLLRAAYLARSDNQTTAALLKESNIVTECHKIWKTLSIEEQKVLAYRSHGRDITEEHLDTLEGLQLKGLLQQQETAVSHLFSPLFAAYATQQEPLWERPIYLDERIKQVSLYGQPINLTAQQLRLFRALYESIDELISKDELVEAGWPGAQGGVSDEALLAAMSRLRRKLEPDAESPHFLENVPELGYRLRPIPEK